MGAGKTHDWSHDECQRCGMRRAERWLLDDRGRPIMALEWRGPRGLHRVRPFPYMLGVTSPARVTQTVDEALPGVPVGREPPCA